MSFDRIVSFKPGAARPKATEIRRVITNFLGGVGKIKEFPKKQPAEFMIVLPGKGTHPLKGIKGAVKSATSDEVFHPDGRWIEVYVRKDRVTFTTRMQDDFVHALDDRLAEVVARFWSGEVSS